MIMISVKCRQVNIFRDMSGRGRVGFLKPQEDGESYEEDRPDIEPLRFAHTLCPHNLSIDMSKLSKSVS